MTAFKKEMIAIACLCLILIAIPVSYIISYPNNKSSSTIVVKTIPNSEVEKICGIYQYNFSDGIGEREFQSSGAYIKRDYTTDNKLDMIVYGKWTFDTLKFLIEIDSCFDIDTSLYGNARRTANTHIDKSYFIKFKNFTSSSIEFFDEATESNPSMWLKWNKIL